MSKLHVLRKKRKGKALRRGVVFSSLLLFLSITVHAESSERAAKVENNDFAVDVSYFQMSDNGSIPFKNYYLERLNVEEQKLFEKKEQERANRLSLISQRLEKIQKERAKSDKAELALLKKQQEDEEKALKKIVSDNRKAKEKELTRLKRIDQGKVVVNNSTQKLATSKTEYSKTLSSKSDTSKQSISSTPTSSSSFSVKNEQKYTKSIDDGDYISKQVDIVATAYTFGDAQNGPGNGMMTASGRKLRLGTLAAPKDIGFGTIVNLPSVEDALGVSQLTVWDRGGAIKRLDADTIRIDICFPDYKSAMNFGVRRYENVTIKVPKVPVKYQLEK